MKAVTKLVLTVVDRVSPIHGEKRGRVIRAPYLVAEGDATNKEDAIRFVKGLQAQGFYF